MRISYLFLIGSLSVFLLGGKVVAQTTPPKKSASDAQRNAQWKPEKGKYYFSHALIYEYFNKVDSTKGELWVFIDPVTGTLCFQRESSFGATDDMNEAILAFPNGQMIACGKTESGKKIRETFKNSSVTPVPEDVEFQRETFRKQCIPTGNTRQEFGWQSTEHTLTYLKTNEKSKLWLAEVPFNVYPLYAFDEWEGDAQLPVSFSYTYLLSPQQLVTEADDAYMTVKLIAYESNPYFLDLNQYAKQY
ncbi:hypothetical protein [Salmonirosea aquatica]|uniref:DUF4412 domain-containing protein n=1 Tax=Salmonirosea aquatica TaxID=2654236 RepID=A0A7C9BAB1_9BACT|nr:hypothetical protein [Cytophagaceae bacterium SJW1-29]